VVRIQEPAPDDRLHALLTELCAGAGLRLDVEGWARRTYDVYSVDGRFGRRRRLLRVESIASTNGEIRVFDDSAMPFATELGARLEQAFPAIGEATILREPAPE
jgi:hypothetical protein